MDLNDRITSGHVQEQFKYEDIHQIIRMIVSQFKTCQELLKIRPLYKKHSENFDKILKVVFDCLLLFCFFNKNFFLDTELPHLPDKLNQQNRSSQVENTGTGQENPCNHSTKLHW